MIRPLHDECTCGPWRGDPARDCAGCREAPPHRCAECREPATLQVDTHVNGVRVAVTLVCEQHRHHPKKANAVLSHVEREVEP